MQFITCSNSTPSEIQGKTEFLNELLNYHNEFLETADLSLTPVNTQIFLSEEIELCNFSSHTERGIKIHKGKMHKNQIWMKAKYPNHI